MQSDKKPKFKAIRLLALDKNFFVPSTMPLKNDRDQIFVSGKTTQLSSRSQILQLA